MFLGFPHELGSMRRHAVGVVVGALLLVITSSAGAGTETWQWEDANPPNIGGGYLLHVWTDFGGFDQQYSLPLQTPDQNNRYHYSVDVPDNLPNATSVSISMQRFDANGVVSLSSNVLTRTFGAPPPANGPPDATIDSPSSAVSINEGQSVNFQASFTDPDADPVSFTWDFDQVGSGVPNSNLEDPGNVVFDTAGSFTVSLTARDDQGNVDPTPAVVTVQVSALGGNPGGSPQAAEAGLSAAGTGHRGGFLLAAPDGDPRVFVVEREGRVRIFEDGLQHARSFLEISGDVSIAGDGGLLGLVFDPDYANNGFFFTYRTNAAGDSLISRFEVSADPYVADASSETVILTVAQPEAGHSGGGLAFGPDGFLFVGLGDGGFVYDPAEVAQDGQALLGKVLRLDVGVPAAIDSIPTGGNYAIPADNPFVNDSSTLNEIWAIGLRNPYRISVDRDTGDLWIADQGRAQNQEINLEPGDDAGGRNYGWDVMEGTACSNVDPASAPVCNDSSLTLPIFEYTSTTNDCAIMGGYVYRGAITDHYGEYFFADECSGKVWSLEPNSGRVTNRTAAFAGYVAGGVFAAGLGEGGTGEIYVLDVGGAIYKIRSTQPECSDSIDNDGDGHIDYPDDPGCYGPTAAFENPICDDQFDNDVDGSLDLADTDCTTSFGKAESTATGSQTQMHKETLCGLGAELLLIFPPLIWLKERRRRSCRKHARVA